MKSHHLLLIAGLVIVGGVVYYEYKKKHCKNCAKCKGCKGKSTASNSASGIPTPTTSPVPAPNASTGNIPQTGLPGVDSIFNPQSGWSGADGMDYDFPVIDPVNHYVPVMGVSKFNDGYGNIIMASDRRVSLNS